MEKDVGYSDALESSIEHEEKAINFYSDVSDYSKSLLSTIPRAFKKVASTREKRKLKLESMLKDYKR